MFDEDFLYNVSSHQRDVLMNLNQQCLVRRSSTASRDKDMIKADYRIKPLKKSQEEYLKPLY